MVFSKQQSSKGLSSTAITAGVGLLLFFLLPTAAILKSPLALFYSLGTVYAVIAAVCLYRKLVGYDPIGILAAAYATGMALSTLFNGGSLINCITYYWSFAAALLLGRAMTPLYSKELLNALLLLCGFYTFSNLAVVLIVPEGTPVLRPNVSDTFLGYRNGFCRFYLPALFASLLLDQTRNKRISALSVSLYVASLAQSIVCYSATSVLALLFVGVLYPALFSLKLRAKLTAPTYLICYLALFVSVVLCRLQNALPTLLGFLGKDITFTGRTKIWDAAIEGIDAEHFLFGHYGASDSVIAPEGMHVFSTAHNAVLDITIWGGIVALVLVIAMFAICASNLHKDRSNLSAGTLSLYLGVFLLMGLVEYFTCAALFLFLGIAAGWRKSTE